MTMITHQGETRTADAWSKDRTANPHKIKAPEIKARSDAAYKGSALFQSAVMWDNHPALQPARPQSEFEWKVRKMIKADIPQFRFDILVEVAKKVGLGVFQKSSLRKQLTKGNWGYAIREEGLLAFNGPGGNVRLSWMRDCADWSRRWQNPWDDAGAP